MKHAKLLAYGWLLALLLIPALCIAFTAQGVLAQPPRAQAMVTAATLLAEIPTPNPGTNDGFGNAVAVDGDIAVIGAVGADQVGAAYVHYRNQGGTNAWGQVAKLDSPDGGAHQGFAASVAISGDTIVVGARQLDSPQTKHAYVYQRDQGGADHWGLVTTLEAGDGNVIGPSVAITGDVAVAGPLSSDQPNHAYVFERNAGGTNHWGQVAALAAADGSGQNLFGFSVAIGGDLIVCGAKGDHGFIGAAYIFEQNLGGSDHWGQLEKLVPSEGAANSGFGHAVAIHGSTVLVGSNFGAGPGGAYIFEQNQGGTNNWGQKVKLPSSDTLAQFGISVSLNGDLALAGAPEKASPSLKLQGGAYAFLRNRGGSENWGALADVVDDDGTAGDQFGSGVAIYNNTLVVGADGKNAAYIYQLSNDAPTGALSPSTMNFSDIPFGTTSPPQQATLTNTGTAPLIIDSIAISQLYFNFSQTNDCPPALAVGESCTINVSFSPSPISYSSAYLTVGCNDPAGNPTMVLTGSGVSGSSSSGSSSSGSSSGTGSSSSSSSSGGSSSSNGSSSGAGSSSSSSSSGGSGSIGGGGGGAVGIGIDVLLLAALAVKRRRAKKPDWAHDRH